MTEATNSDSRREQSEEIEFGTGDKYQSWSVVIDTPFAAHPRLTVDMARVHKIAGRALMLFQPVPA